MSEVDSDVWSQPPSAVAGVLRIAAWFGLVSGFLEGLIFTVIRVVPGWMTWQMRTFSVSAEILWIAPICNAALFLALGLGLAVVIAAVQRLVRIPDGLPEKVAVVVFGWLTFYAAITVSGRIYPWAVCLLALGLCVQVSRWFANRQPMAMALVQRSLMPLAGAVVLTAIIIGVWGRVQEAGMTRGLPPVAAQRPNVLLLVLDTLRADHLSAYGYERPTTPHIDDIATQGVLFENAFASAPWTTPSHASMLTGLHVYEHKADGLYPVVGTQFPILAETMMAQGYVTGGFSANTWWLTRDSGFDRGFIRFEDYTRLEMATRTVFGREIATRVVPRLGYRNFVGRKTAGAINRAFVTWLDAQRGNSRPFFALLNYIEVHGPYLSPEPYHTQFMTEQQREREPRFTFRPPQVADNTPPGARAMLLAGYDGSLAYLDAQIGALFAELRARGLLDNTLIILTADHGEAFGEHGLYAHGHSLYANQLSVPLMMTFPGRVPAGVRVSTPVCIRDIAATVAALALPDVAPVLPGISLASSWDGSAAQVERGGEPILSEALPRDGLPQAWPVSQGWLKSLLTPDWHFILREAGAVELYDRRTDPAETANLADTPAAQAVVERFQKMLDRLPANSNFAAIGARAG